MFLMRKANLIIYIVAHLCLQCSDRNHSAPSKLSLTPSPIPEASEPFFPEHPNPDDAAPKRPEELISGSMAVRYSVPGKIRWFVDVDAPITDIRWSALKGFSVSVGKEVLNISSKGELRWRQTAGFGHKIITIGDTEAVWSPSFSQIIELGQRGSSSWNRTWNGSVEEKNNEVFLLDASTVSALDQNGQDKWRAALDGIRNLEGPFKCKDSFVFHGAGGMVRKAVEVSQRGLILRITDLSRGAQMLDTDNLCNPLIWRDGELKLLNDKGIAVWTRNYSVAPLVSRLEKGFFITSGRASSLSVFEMVADDGKTYFKGNLPVNGRLFKAEIISSYGLDVKMLGLCLDVTHPCAKPGSGRGPYNALVTSDGKGGFRAMLRHTSGHLGAIALDNENSIIASSKDENATDVEMRDRYQKVIWQLTLPGRLSAGPYAGPYGGVYVATCTGWNCEKPYRLFSITATKQDEKSEDADLTGL